MDKENKQIMVNGTDGVWVERNGELIKTDILFKNDDEILEIAQGMATYCGRELNVSNPILHAMIHGHFHAHLIIHPVSVKGTTITIFNVAPEERFLYPHSL